MWSHLPRFELAALHLSAIEFLSHYVHYDHATKLIKHPDGTWRRQAQPLHAEATWLEKMLLEGILSRGGEGLNVNSY